jgi:hypothetical protein
VEENMYQQKDKHCCGAMDSVLERGDSALFYTPELRRYAIKECNENCDCGGKKKRSLMMINVINRCPWCGVLLPKDLSNTWEMILEKEYNIDNPWNIHQECLIPQEFLLDEWWKKRGL